MLDDARIGLLENRLGREPARIVDDPVRRVIGKVFDNLYSSGTRDKYRTRVERGANGTTDIFISHRGMEEKERRRHVDAGFPLEPRKSEPEYESRDALSDDDLPQGAPKDQAAQIAQSTISPAAAAARVDQANCRDGAVSYLTVSDNFERTGAASALALDRVGFTVVDRDRTAGTFFVRYYADPEVIAERGRASSTN